MNTYHILGQHAHWNINKKLAREVGIDAALIISDLISKREYFIMNKDITIEDWFFNTQENIETDTGLSPHQQRKCFEILKQKGFIETKRSGIPAKQHFKIFDVQLLNFLITGYEDTSHLINKNKPNNNKPIKNKELFAFNDFWNKYPIKKAKAKAESVWKNLKAEDKEKIMNTIDAFISHKPFETYNHPNPTTYLNQKRWEDELKPTQNKFTTTQSETKSWMQLKAEQKRKEMEEQFKNL